jgi:hypothetical protein
MYTQQYNRRRELVDMAHQLYERAWRRGQLHRFWARLTGRSTHLPLLRDVRGRYSTITTLEKVRRPVRVDRILGSDAGLGFDSHFYPIDRRSRDRWISIAELMIDDPTSVPPIQVVEVCGDFYVIDGHHRVSVARLLDHLYLDADVTVWQLIENCDENKRGERMGG